MKLFDTVIALRDITIEGNEIDKPWTVFNGEKGVITSQVRKRVFVVAFDLGDVICFSREIESVQAREARRFALWSALCITGVLAVLYAVHYL